MWYRYQPVLIIQLVVVVGSKEHRLSLDHLLGQQQKDPSDYVSSQTWSIFNVFGSDSQSDFDKAAGPSEKTERGELSSPSLPPGPQPGKLGKSRGGTSNGRKGGQARANASPAKLKPNRPEEEWLKIIEDELPAAGAAATDDKHASKNNTSSRPHNDLQGSKRAKASGFLPAPKSAASTGGLLPTRVYVINSDSAVERWVQFRGRWSIVHRLSETFHNESAASSEDTPLNPVRFRAADLRPKQSASRAGASSASSSAASSFGSNEKVAWTRRLDVLPPRARRAAFECQEQAQRRGGGDGGYLDALSYSLSHLALWESLAMDRSLKKDDRVLILDDSARPRQRWREILARHAAAVPKDWDILALGWWGRVRKEDRVHPPAALASSTSVEHQQQLQQQLRVYHVIPPVRRRRQEQEEGGGDDDWVYYYAGAHARLMRGRVFKRLVVGLSKLARGPKCRLLWPDADAIVWAATRRAEQGGGANYYALRDRLFGLGEASPSATPMSSTPNKGSSSSILEVISRRGSIASGGGGSGGYDEFERWVAQPSEGPSSPKARKADGRGSFSGRDDDDDDDDGRDGGTHSEAGEGSKASSSASTYSPDPGRESDSASHTFGVERGEAGFGRGGSGGELFQSPTGEEREEEEEEEEEGVKQEGGGTDDGTVYGSSGGRSLPSDPLSSATVRRIRAKLPPQLKCRTIVNRAKGTEREVCQ